MGNTSQMDYEAVQRAYQDVHDKEGTVRTVPFTTPMSAADEEEERGDGEGTDQHTGRCRFISWLLFSWKTEVLCFVIDCSSVGSV